MVILKNKAKAIRPIKAAPVKLIALTILRVIVIDKNPF